MNDAGIDEDQTIWLRDLLARHGAIAGTVHVVHGDQLEIRAAVNIPPRVREVTATIPLGKGMAGLAWQHDKPIQTCNLQGDATGAVKPGAKAVDAQGAVALPVHAGDGTVRAIVGLAWRGERVLDATQLAAISADAASLA